VDHAVFVLCEAWWQEQAGLGALWRARTLSAAALFCAAGVTGTVLGVLVLRPLRPRREVHVAHLGPRSLLGRAVGFGARHSFGVAAWAWAVATLLFALSLSAHADDWALWQHSLHRAQNLGADKPSGIAVEWWLWRAPWEEALHGGAWRAASAWLLIALVTRAFQVLCDYAAPREGTATSESTRKYLRVPSGGSNSGRGPACVWGMGAVWWGLAGGKYLLDERGLALVARGLESSGPWAGAGWNWMSWHIERPLLQVGAALCLLSGLVCIAQAVRPLVNGRARGQLWAAPLPRAALFAAAFYGPGVASLLVAPLAFALVVAPAVSEREAPFRSAQRAQMALAWRLSDIERRSLQLRPVPRHDSARAGVGDVEAVLRGARVWDEGEAGRAVGAAATMAVDRGELVALGAGGRDGGSGFRAPAGAWRTTSDGSLTSRPLTLAPVLSVRAASWPERLAWAWRLRSPRLLLDRADVQPFATLSQLLAHALPGAVVLDESVAPDGSRVASLAWPLAWPGAGTPSPHGTLEPGWGGLAAPVLCEWAKARAAPGQGVRLFLVPQSDSRAEVLKRAFPVVRPWAAWPASLRDSVRFPKPLFSARQAAWAASEELAAATMNPGAPERVFSAHEYALVGQEGFALQNVEARGARLLALHHAWGRWENYGRWTRWQMADALLPPARKTQAESREMSQTASGSEQVLAPGVVASRVEAGPGWSALKEERLHGKVLVLLVPAPPDGLQTPVARGAQVLARSVGAASIRTLLWLRPRWVERVRHEPGQRAQASVHLESVELCDLATGRAAMGRDVQSAWASWNDLWNSAPQSTRAAPSTDARQALRLHSAAQEQARRGNWAQAARLWRQEQGLLEKLARP
jgi:hypothetical protein